MNKFNHNCVVHTTNGTDSERNFYTNGTFQSKTLMINYVTVLCTGEVSGDFHYYKQAWLRIMPCTRNSKTFFLLRSSTVDVSFFFIFTVVVCCRFSIWVLCLFLKVLLFLQKKKEESPSEAQVRQDGDGRKSELETLWSLSSFKWKQLHRPPPPPLISFKLPLFTCLLLSLCFCHFVPPPHALSLLFSRSQCSPATDELKECCSPTDSTTDSWFLYRQNWTYLLYNGGSREK